MSATTGAASASSAGVGGLASAPAEGLIRNMTPDMIKLQGIDIYAPGITPADLWGPDCIGSELLDNVVAIYGESTQDIPIYSQGLLKPDRPKREARAMIKSPLSRVIQWGTVHKYKGRTFSESMSQVAAGHRNTRQ